MSKEVQINSEAFYDKVTRLYDVWQGAKSGEYEALMFTLGVVKDETH